MRNHFQLMLKEMRFAAGLYLGAALGSIFGMVMGIYLFHEVGCGH